jgi:putative nucleotidyltransferase with HDIG domain
MIAADRLERAGRAYFRIIPILGVCVLGWALLDLVLHPPSPAWLALAALTVLTGSFTVKIPGLVARLSVSEPFVFAATLWFGPAVGAVTAALDALIMSLWLLPSLKTIERVAFNVSVLVISIWTASQGFFALAGIDSRAPVYNSLAEFILPLYLFTACSFLLNSGLIAVALSFERKQRAFKIWREQFLWLSLNYFGGASVAAVLVVYAKSMDWAVVGIIVPLLAISYLTFRTTLGRLDDANSHLRVLNRLYLSTIETLAMAVDAKDQVTHGHIRRVQKYALGLAGVLGIRDERQVKAIEAAALLHDMGKLAIPEFILNKPGRLTPLEFDKMKLHAGIGADILSAIDFPYPVIPIVRHHHENWDGSGYPDGLKGTAIPLGARILSVVDCYDALTSDRPYRPRLSPEDALRVVMERRGVMYDPIVVDSFAANISALEESTQDLGAESPTLRQIAELNNPATLSALHSSAAADATSNLQPASQQHWAQTLKGDIEIADLAATTLGHLAAAIPATACAIYLVDKDGASVYLASAAGDIPASYLGRRTEFGRRIAGWVAANKVSALNSIAELDFDDAHGAGGLRSSLVCPLLTNNEVVGVLGLYSPDERGFTRPQQATAEEFALLIVQTLRIQRTQPESSPQAPNGIDQLISKAEDSSSWWPVGVAVVRLPKNLQPHSAEDDVRATLRESIRAEDSLLKLDRDAFLLLLLRSNNSTTREVASRIQKQLASLKIEAVLEWASVDRGPDADAQAFGSLADAIRHTAFDSNRGSRTH